MRCIITAQAVIIVIERSSNSFRCAPRSPLLRAPDQSLLLEQLPIGGPLGGGAGVKVPTIRPLHEPGEARADRRPIAVGKEKFPGPNFRVCSLIG